MSASTYVGRVGGLAVALGVGAAVIGGTAVGWADDTTTPGSSAEAGSAQAEAPSRGSRGAASATGGTAESGPAAVVRGRGTRSAADSDAAPTRQRSSDSVVTLIPDVLPGNLIQREQPRAAAADPQPAVEIRNPQPTVAPDAQSSGDAGSGPAPVAAPALDEIAPVSESAAEPLAAPAAAVASVPTGTLTALDDPLAGSNRGTVPVDTPLDWAVLAFSRRNALSAASTLAVPQPAATTSQPTIPIIIGPSGVPIPPAWYVTNSQKTYIPNALTDLAQVLFTPEGLYPITGTKSLPLNTSVDQGIQILSAELNKLPAGTPTTVFGYSQSAIMASLLKGGYTVDVSGVPTKFEVPAGLADSIEFTLVGNEVNPDGGFLSRFSGRGMPMLTLESLGIPFYGAAPAGPSTGVEYKTLNYTREYDGFADFPRYPINLLADINAGLGIVYVHVQYVPNPDKTPRPAYFLTQEQVDNAVVLPTTQTSQQYRFIPTENLPLLQPLREITFLGLGEALADLLQPSLKALVDFGYADPAHGYTSGTQPYANELQPFDFLPPADLYPEAFKRFFDGIGQGIRDFIGNFGPNGAVTQAISNFSLPTLGPLAMGTAGGFISSIQQVITSVTDYISGTAASIYAALLPTADIINALVVELPGYATNLFLYGMQEVFSGNVIQGLSDAIGLPIAATIGLSSTASLVGALVWGQALSPLFPKGHVVP